MDKQKKLYDNQQITLILEEEMYPEELKYTEDHEWVKLEDGIATIGISQHASDELGEIVFVELPDVDTEFGQSDEFGTVESVKTVSSLYAPITGKVVEVNDDLTNNPNTVNDEPYSDGWIVKLACDDDTEYQDLMTHEEYAAFLENLD